MADELNIPTHRWYQKRNHVALAKEDVSRQYIYDSGIQKIDAWINSQPWGDVYIVNRLSPNLVFDFDATYYRTGGTATDLVSAATHTRAGNATMVDSDGFRKWAPHNLLTYSEEFDNAAWTKYGVTVSGTDLVIPTATLSYHFVQNSAASFISKYTKEFEAKPEGYNFVRLFMGIIGVGVDLDLVNKTFSNKSPEYADPVFTDSTDGFVKVSIEYIGTRTNKAIALQPEPSALNTTTFTGDGVSGVRFREARLYRSDLGGMVNNPATGDSYVPTTDAAKYLPRVGHHIWNGSAWVDEGYLHESEARTNLALGSNDFLPANNYWQEYISSNRVTVTAGQEIGPDGTLSMSLLTDGVVTTAAHGLTTFYDQSPTIANGTTFTASCYIKDKDRRYVTVVGSGNTSNNWFAVTVDLLDGSITQTGFGATSNLTSSSVEATGDGIYRISVSGNVMDSETKTGVWIFLADTPTPVYGTYGQSNHDGANLGVYTYGAQLETGSVPTSHIPTAGATVTRAADAMTIPAANLPWPEPVVIGPELFSDFTSEGEWVDNGDGSWTVTNATTATDLRRDGLTALGKHYEYSFDLTTTAPLIVYLSSPVPDLRPTGSYTFNNVSTSAFFIFRAIAGTTATVSNISVREIEPLAVSFQLSGRMTYADTSNKELTFFDWRVDSGNYIQANLRTQTTATGEVYHIQAAASVTDDVDGRSSQYTPGVNVPFNIASRHGSTFINGAVDGVALTADLTPTALPDLSATDLQLASSGGPMIISKFRMWADDLTDAGIEEASA